MALVVTEARSYSAGSGRSSRLEPSSLSSSDAFTEPVALDETCCGQALRPFRADDGRYMSVCMRCGKEITHMGMAHYGGSPWIGVDLDGTLARDSFDAEHPDQIGEPIEPMMQRVRQWLEDGVTVKVFTARAAVPRQVQLVKQWLKEHDLPDLEVTNAKDFKMIELWDDRAVRVGRNSGTPTSQTEKPTNSCRSRGRTPSGSRRSRGSFLSKLRMMFAL